ncbi:MAG: hypothetical protein AB7F94_05250 [Nitrospira sp.]
MTRKERKRSRATPLVAEPVGAVVPFGGLVPRTRLYAVSPGEMRPENATEA